MTQAKETQSIGALTSQAKEIMASIASRSRLLKSDRVKAGKLLIALRGKFSVHNKNGKVVRGAKGSTFVAHLKANSIPIPTAYSYIAAAEGKSYGVAPNRVQFWLKLNTQMKKSTPAQKVLLLKQAVAHLVKLYAVDAVFTVRGK
jgi:hypothetical protein